MFEGQFFYLLKQSFLRTRKLIISEYTCLLWLLSYRVVVTANNTHGQSSPYFLKVTTKPLHKGKFRKAQDPSFAGDRQKSSHPRLTMIQWIYKTSKQHNLSYLSQTGFTINYYMFDFSVMGGSILQGIKDWIGESSSGNDQSDQPDSIKLLPVVAALAGTTREK